jgi:hypothetical protein
VKKRLSKELKPLRQDGPANMDQFRRQLDKAYHELVEEYRAVTARCKPVSMGS